MIDLEGRNAVVTGAGSKAGIGYAVCRQLHDAGARVVALDIVFAPQYGAPWECMVCDIADRQACERVFATLRSSLAAIDILVNNAGIVAPTRLADIEPPDFERMVQVNLTGVFNVTQAALPALKRSAAASIVNLASIAAQRGGGLLGGAHYAASKGGVASFTKACARELGGFGIRANAVNPGIIETDMTAGKYPAGRLENLLPQIPLARLGQPADVAKAILFLASDLSAYITGTEIDVNGGYHIH